MLSNIIKKTTMLNPNMLAWKTSKKLKNSHKAKEKSTLILRNKTE